MSNKNKSILKIWLFLYIVFSIFKIINIFNNEILNNVFSIGTFPLEITSLILFVYVANRGEEKIGRYGIISIIIYFVFYVLYSLNVYDLGIMSTTNFKNKVCSIIYYTSNNCISILEYMALFSLITGNNKVQKYKMLAIVCITGFSLINLMNNLFLFTKIDFITNIKHCLDYIGAIAKYAVIILYLTDDNYSQKSLISNDTSQAVVPQNTVNTSQSVQNTMQNTVYGNQLVQPQTSQNMVNTNQTTPQSPTQNTVYGNQLVQPQTSQNMVNTNQTIPQSAMQNNQTSTINNQVIYK